MLAYMDIAHFGLRDGVILVHAIAASIGLGAVFTTDYVMMQFIKNGRIGESQVKVMKALSEVIWIALTGLILSGIYLAVTKIGVLESSKFLLKMVVVGVLFINGLFLNFFVTPRMTRIAFHEGDILPHDEPDSVRKIAMTAGGISAFSWLLAFLLGKFYSIPLSIAEGIGAYLIALSIIALGVMFTKKKKM